MTSNLKALSLFSGMGGDSLGIQYAGGEVVAFNEFDKAAIESHLLNFPDSVLVQDPSQKKPKDRTNIQCIPDSSFAAYKGVVDLIFAGHPCFVAGTLVLTKRGYKKIEDVKLEDTLLTHTGSFQKILNLQQKQYQGDLFEINTKYHPGAIKCTEEHPFYVREKTKKWNPNTNSYDIFYSDPKWKSAKELTINDHFGMVINSNMSIPGFVFQKKINQYKKEDISIQLDKDEHWFTMGYFVGNGWIEETTTKSDGKCRNIIRFAINEDDESEVMEKISKTISIVDINCNTGKSKIFGCSDFLWFNILKIFGKGAHIPEWVQDAPGSFIMAFLEGYEKASGCTKKNGSISIPTVSYNLALSIQRLYLKVGYIYGIEKTNRSKSCESDRDHKHTYCIRGYEQELLCKKSSFIENGYVWYASKEITSSPVESTLVYNFEVENDNTYVVENTVVHNCQGFSNGGKKLPDDPRNTLFREFARSARLIMPKYIIGENVDGLLSRKTADNENYIDVIVREFESIGYNVYYKVFHTVQYGVPQLRKRLVYVGIRKDLNQSFSFPEPLNDGKHDLPNLKNIIQFSMEGAIKIEPDDFDMTSIPDECIIRNMDNDDGEDTDNIHPYLRLKAKTRNETYGNKTHPNLLSFAKRDSPIHAEVIDIRNPSKTIICTYDHQPRLFVPLQNKNGYYLRCILPDELKQIQGFPANYQLYGNKKDKVKQIGNAVPPPLIHAIVKKLIP
jgi:DNA (cytosine-5)-methyltransferase 1